MGLWREKKVRLFSSHNVFSVCTSKSKFFATARSADSFSAKVSYVLIFLPLKDLPAKFSFLFSTIDHGNM